MDMCNGSAVSRPPAQAPAAITPDVFKKSLREEPIINDLSLDCELTRLLALDRLRGRVPYRYAVMEVRVICHVAGDRRVVPEHLVLGDVLPRLHRVEEVRQVVGRIVVPLRRGVRLHQSWSGSGNGGLLGMRTMPLVEILPLRLSRPAIERIPFRLRARILRRQGDGVAADRHGCLAAIEDNGLASRIVLIA